MSVGYESGGNIGRLGLEGCTGIAKNMQSARTYHVRMSQLHAYVDALLRKDAG